MTMDLKEALEVVEQVRSEAKVSGEEHPSAAREAEALGVVLSAAQENHPAALVARVQQTTAEVFGITPHPFLRVSPGSAHCRQCLGQESNHIHRPVAP